MSKRGNCHADIMFVQTVSTIARNPDFSQPKNCGVGEGPQLLSRFYSGPELQSAPTMIKRPAAAKIGLASILISELFHKVAAALCAGTPKVGWFSCKRGGGVAGSCAAGSFGDRLDRGAPLRAVSGRGLSRRKDGRHWRWRDRVDEIESELWTPAIDGGARVTASSALAGSLGTMVPWVPFWPAPLRPQHGSKLHAEGANGG